MKVRTVPSRWLYREGMRLDCGPYTSGGVEVRERLAELPAPKSPLSEVTNRIFHAGRESRTWVEAPKYGVPFLSSSAILSADLSHLPLISKKQFYSKTDFRIDEGWTLISRSGTIGRTVYVRPEMDGMACSEHAMRVVPDADKIPPGYLYAFLSSKYGVPLVVSGTYGAIIQSIEPHHIADLPVPRFGPFPDVPNRPQQFQDSEIREAMPFWGQVVQQVLVKMIIDKALQQATEKPAQYSEFEWRVHQLVQQAAEGRTEAANLIVEADRRLFSRLGMVPPSESTGAPVWRIEQSTSLLDRCDAFYFATSNIEARSAFDATVPNGTAQLEELQNVAEVFIPGIFKRRYAEDPEWGCPYLTGADVFTLAPTSQDYLMNCVADEYHLRLTEGMVVVQEAGQLHGIIGRPVLIGRRLNGFACTNNMVRIQPRSAGDTGYLFAVLNSEYGTRLMKREAAGSSIPHIEAGRVRRIQIPWPGQSDREWIGSPIVEAQRLRDSACEMEDEARRLVESAIEEGGA